MSFLIFVNITRPEMDHPIVLDLAYNMKRDMSLIFELMLSRFLFLDLSLLSLNTWIKVNYLLISRKCANLD